MFSPPKRRKTSETTAAAIDASQAHPPSLEGDSRTRSRDRTSFQSPTRASLARSHPDVLARAMSRSPTRRPASKGNEGSRQQQAGDRVFGLRDRKALRPSLTSTGSPMDKPQPSTGAFLLSPARRSSAFAFPPRRASRKIAPGDLAFGSPVAQQTAAKEHADTPDGQLASELDNATGVDAPEDLEPPSLQEVLDEPELPPTPTQLGLEKPPERPKGLLSSSPTGRHGKRTRRRTTDTLQPSPLKLRSMDAGADLDNLSGLGLKGQSLLPETVVKRQKLKTELSTEMKRLQDDIASLEAYTEKIRQHDEDTELTPQEFSKLISLLTSDDASRKPSSSKSRPGKTTISSLLSTLLPFGTKAPRVTRPPSPSPTNPFALKETTHPKPYLTVFAPLTLTAHSNEISASKSEALRETHHLVLSAPPPFPPNLYNVPITYDANPETQTIISVSTSAGVDDAPENLPEVIRRWIRSRLANPLLKLDVSGLCWGINRYWEAAILRAQIWATLESQHSKLVAGRTSDPSSRAADVDTSFFNSQKNGVLSTSDLRRLIPHLERTTMLFNSTEKTTLQLLLSCELTVDEWTSEPQLTPSINIDISTSSSSSSPSSTTSSDKKIDQEAKKLFYGLLNEYSGSNEDGVGSADVDSILRATHGVLGALFGVDSEQKTLPAKTQKKR